MKKQINLVVLVTLLFGGPLYAQVPQLVNYQGRIAVDSANFGGAGQFKFALVNGNGTVTFWSNDGTSAGGSEPTAVVTLTVANGLYSVLLGDTLLGNMTAIPASAFTSSDVRLRVWFNDGVHGSQLLAPDQRIAPAAYLADGTVTSASVGAGAITSGKIAPGAVNGTNIAPASLDYTALAVSGPPNNGQVLGYNNGNLTWSAPGGVFALNGTNGYYNGGNIGIGTQTPASKLEIRTVTHATGFLHSDGTTSVGSYIGPGQFGATGGWFGTFTPDPLNFFVNNGEPSLTINAAGNVGIGTIGPSSKLHVSGAQDALGLGGAQPFLTFTDTSSIIGVGYARSRIQGVGGDVVLMTESYLSGTNSSAFLDLKNSGKVGIGTNIPETKLEVHTASGTYGMMHSDGTIKVASYVGGSASGASGGWFGTVSDNPLFFFVHGGQPVLTIGTDRTVSVPVLRITGGADLAEPFPMKEDVVEKGSVVVIDSEHPGGLKRSTRSYDKRVAGIVSGANGVNPGIALHQEGAMEGDHNVALTGRVYVKADASAGPIEPGDLLTTSDTPGHAMKVIDYQRAQGAALGKAMSSLKEGTGLVLVLVSLQ